MHGKERQGVLVPLSIDEGVPSEVNGQKVILGAHAAEVPLDGVIKAEPECGDAVGHEAVDG